MKSYLAVFLSLILLNPVAHAGSNYSGIIEASVEKHARPAFSNFSLVTQNLHKSVVEQCETGKIVLTPELKKSFNETIEAWSSVYHLKWGPARVDYRHERMSFGADPANYVSRQLSQLVRDQDLGVLERGQLKDRSIAIQGLTALEILLTAPLGDRGRNRYVCQLSVAITQNIADMADTMDTEWNDDGGYVRSLRSPDPDHPLITSERDAAMEFFKPLAGGLRFLIDMDLKDPLQSSPENARPTYLAYYKTEATKISIDAKLRGMRDLFVDGGFYEALRVHDQDLSDRIITLFESAIIMNDGIEGGYFDAIQDEAQRAEIQELIDVLDELWLLIVYDMAEHFDFIVGFNQFDGD